jgi:hypothetical protein
MYGWYRLSKRHKWHLVESLIDGDHVTKCGRRLQARPADEVSTEMPLTRMIDQPQLCKGGCS